MKRLVHCVIFCFVVSSTFYIMSAFSDLTLLRSSVIRMHIIANSDDPEDQQVKLKIRDAICAEIEGDLNQIQDLDQARAYILENIPKLERIANLVLQNAGMDPDARITLGNFYFPSRIYDTFRLPSGIYEALRVTIGEGAGKNWWCVAFPTFCRYVSQDDFQAAVVSAGFPDRLTDSLLLNSDCEYRFYIMDFLGKYFG